MDDSKTGNLIPPGSFAPAAFKVYAAGAPPIYLFDADKYPAAAGPGAKTCPAAFGEWVGSALMPSYPRLFTLGAVPAGLRGRGFEAPDPCHDHPAAQRK
jgi:hypothetical protein